MTQLNRIVLTGLLAIILSACGGGSSGPSNATINAGNAKQLGTAAAEAAKQSQLDKTGMGFKADGDSPIQVASAKISRMAANRIAYSDGTCSSGTHSDVANSDGSFTFTFGNCNIGPLVLNGSVVVFINTVGDTTTIRISYSNFTLFDGTDTVTVSMDANCTINTLSGDASCSFTNLVGFDGRRYNITNVAITEDAFGYYITATVTDPDHGNITINTTAPITFGCSNGQPMTGQIQFTDADGVVVTVNFDSCLQFTVSYSGTSTTYDW